MMRKLFKLFVFASIFLSMFFAANATSYSSVTSGLWYSNNTWGVASGFPGLGDTAIITSGNIVSGNGTNINITTLTIDSSGVFNGSTEQFYSNGTVTINGNFSYSNAGTFTANGSVTIGGFLGNTNWNCDFQQKTNTFTINNGGIFSAPKNGTCTITHAFNDNNNYATNPTKGVINNGGAILFDGQTIAYENNWWSNGTFNNITFKGGAYNMQVASSNFTVLGTLTNWGRLQFTTGTITLGNASQAGTFDAGDGTTNKSWTTASSTFNILGASNGNRGIFKGSAFTTTGTNGAHTVNWKWININLNYATPSTSTEPYIMNFIGNMSLSGQDTIGAADVLNVSVPDTYVTFPNSNHIFLNGNLTIRGNATNLVYFGRPNSPTTLQVGGGADHTIQYATMDAVDNAIGAGWSYNHASGSTFLFDNFTYGGGGLGVYSGFHINSVNNPTPIFSNCSIKGWNGAAYYQKDVDINTNGAKAIFDNCLFNQTGSIGTTGWILSKNHYRKTGDWRYWGVMTTSVASEGYKAGNWTSSTNITLLNANSYGTAYNTSLVLNETASANSINITFQTYLNITSGALTTYGTTYLTDGGNININNGNWINLTLNDGKNTMQTISGSNVQVWNFAGNAPADVSGYLNISKYVNITNTSATSILLNISYSDANIAGVLESSLRIWNYNGSIWAQATNSSVNAAANVVTANISTFSNGLFAAFGTPALSACGVINTVGTTILLNNLNNTRAGQSDCVNIQASNVVLDCAGYSITHNKTGITYGVYASNRANITVKNCLIQNYTDGIYFTSVTNGSLIFNNTLTSNVNHGILYETSTNSQIINNTANLNSQHGISFVTTSTGNNITGNTANNNTWRGINIDASNNNVVKDNTASNNGIGGFGLGTTTGNTFTNNTAQNNKWDFISEDTTSPNIVNNLNIGSANITFDGIDFYLNGTFTKPANPTGYINISKYVWATNYSNLGWLYLNISYSNSDVANLDESLLAIARYNNTWETNTSIFSSVSGVNTAANYVYARITAAGFSGDSIFAPFGVNSAPTSNNPIVNSTSVYNLTSGNITCYPQNLSDVNNEAVWPVFNWYNNNISFTQLNMPFDVNISATTTNAVTDYSGYKNNGTLGAGAAANAPVWTKSGKLGGAYVFDGTNDFINISHSASLDLSNKWTLSAWINRGSTGLQQGIIEKYDLVLGKGGYAMRIASNDKLQGYIIKDTGGQNCQSNVTIPANQWYFVAVTFDTDTNVLSCYVNGTLDSTAAATNNPPSSSVSLKIGARGDDASWSFNGTIDEPKVFNKTLSATQIYQMYLEGLNTLNTSTIVSNELSQNDNYMCQVTPNDLTVDGLTRNSTSLLIDPIPQISFVSPTPASGATVTTSLTINLSVSDNNLLNATIYLYNSTNNLYNSTYFTVAPFFWNTSVPDGTYFFNATAFDASTQQNSTETRNVTVTTSDITSPTINYVTPTEVNNAYLNRNSISVNITASDANLANITIRIYNLTTLLNTSVSLTSPFYLNYTVPRDGNYTFNATASDTSNNINSTSTRQVLIDTVVPSIQFVSPTETNNTKLTRRAITINVTASDTNLANITIYVFNITSLVNETTTATSPNFVNITLPADGNYTFNATSVDIANNKNSTETRIFFVDTVNPAISITYPVNTTYIINVSALNYTVSDANLQACWYSLNNGATNTSVACGTNLTNLVSTEGSNSWRVYANDTAGNTNSSSVTFFKDTVTPTISIVAPANTTYTNRTQLVNISTSGANNVWFYNGTANQTYTSTVYILFSEGSNTMQAYANDTAGNFNQTSVTFSIDSTIPLIQFVSPTENNSANVTANSVIVNITASDTNLANITVRLYNSSALINTSVSTTSPFYLNFTNLSDDDYSFNATAIDTFGNQNNTATRSITIDVQVPAIQFVSPTQANGTSIAATSISINVTASNRIANITIYLYNSSALINNYTAFAATANLTVSNLSTGTYYYNATAIDFGGKQNSTETRSIILAAAAPSAPGVGGGAPPLVEFAEEPIMFVKVGFLKEFATAFVQQDFCFTTFMLGGHVPCIKLWWLLTILISISAVVYYYKKRKVFK